MEGRQRARPAAPVRGRHLGRAVETAALQAALLEWSSRSRRDLPWRRTRDPWAVLVSETMLQQTQVARVVPKYHAFLTAFPTAAACAAAPVAEVIRHWHGLGYNRRAINLHAAAVAVVERHGGEVPGDLTLLRALPGVGAYTARAVMAFAFEADHGVVDVNAARVLARVAGRSLRPAEVQQLADEVVPRGQAWAWNQAMLDLGATICRPLPRCDACPVRAECAWGTTFDRTMAVDPATGSAGIPGRQSTFEGSDRQGRGRLVSALRSGAVPLADLAVHAGWPDDEPRARRVLDTLLADGLATIDGALVRLP